MAEVLISEYGTVRNTSTSDFIYNERECFRRMFLDFLIEEINNPGSEIYPLLEKAMNTIADKEIVKVLE